MKLKASVLGSVTRAVLGIGYLGAGERVLVTHLLRGYFSFMLSGSTAGCGLEVGVSCGPATALNLSTAFPSWTFGFPFWVGKHLL